MTLNNIYQKTLERLQAVAAGESAAAEDTQLIASKYVSVWNYLKVQGLVSWAVDESVPDEAAESLISILAFSSAAEFGDEQSKYAVAGAIGLPQPSIAERQLRVLHSRRYVPTPARTEYF